MFSLEITLSEIPSPELLCLMAANTLILSPALKDSASLAPSRFYLLVDPKIWPLSDCAYKIVCLH